MDSTDIKDKIVIDPSDNAAVAELFSTKQPGDVVEGTFKAALDEAGEKVITLSITEIAFKGKGDDEAPPKSEADDAEAGDGDSGESAALTIYKNKDGVPANEENEAVD